MPFRVPSPPLPLRTLGNCPPPGPMVAADGVHPQVGRFVSPVLAYVNERGPSRGTSGLLDQLTAIRRRAQKDGVPLQELIIESGGATTVHGVGFGLARTAAAAACVPKPRVLYLADTRHLAAEAASQLEALRLCFAAGFEVRTACGRISPRGRHVAALRLAVAAGATMYADVGSRRTWESRGRSAHAVGSVIDSCIADSA